MRISMLESQKLFQKYNHSSIIGPELTIIHNDVLFLVYNLLFGVERMTETLYLRNIIQKYGNNKNYRGEASLYDILFFLRRHGSITLLEIGLGSSNKFPASALKVWKEYFPKGRIIGIDSESNIPEEDRIEIYSSIDAIKDIEFDIIIDSEFSIRSELERVRMLHDLFPLLKDHGLYMIENITIDSKLIEFPGLIGCACNHSLYCFFGLQNKICVIQK